MDTYIQLYQDNYKNQLALSHKYIKKELILHAREYHDKAFATNSILRKIYEINKHLIDLVKPYKELVNLFNQRCDVYSFNHQYQIIPKKIEPAFLQIKNSTKELELFVIQLATIDAYEETARLFHNNISIYKRIFELNRFDLIQIDKYIPLTDNSDLNDQLYNGTINKKPLEECITQEDTLELIEYYKLNPLEEDIVTNYEDASNQSVSKNFKIKAEFRDSFKDSYEIFIKHFIDENKVSKICFENVFLKDPNSHDCKIYFFCDNPTASYLLHKLNKSLFKDLTQTNIERSKKFISENGTPFSQSTISFSKKYVSLDNEEIINNFIENIIKSKHKR